MAKKSVYFSFIMLLERLHRLFLEVVRYELERLGVQNLNSVQAIILYNIGNNNLTVGDISNRGYYLGSNVSYNLRKMTTSGYVVQKRSETDRRSVYVTLSAEGEKVAASVERLLEKHVETLAHNGIKVEDLEPFAKQGRKLEEFWSQMLHSISL